MVWLVCLLKTENPQHCLSSLSLTNRSSPALLARTKTWWRPWCRRYRHGGACQCTPSAAGQRKKGRRKNTEERCQQIKLLLVKQNVERKDNFERFCEEFHDKTSINRRNDISIFHWLSMSAPGDGWPRTRRNCATRPLGPHHSKLTSAKMDGIYKHKKKSIKDRKTHSLKPLGISLERFHVLLLRKVQDK